MQINEYSLRQPMITLLSRDQGLRRAQPRFVLFYSRSMSHSEGQRGRSLITSRQGLLWIIGLFIAACGCGTTHAILRFTAPPRARAGTAFTVTVSVLYQGKPDTVINSRIHFTSSDPDAVLPPDYYFAPGDAGSHTWTNGFTLATPGNQMISATIADAAGIDGSSTIAVSP
jgi:hypothetical protein